MATPLYISLGFSLYEIAAVSKLVGFFPTVTGALIGGVVTARFGARHALLLCGLLQSAGNLFYVHAVGGHRLDHFALCVTAENIVGAMAGSALVAYLSGLCSPGFTRPSTRCFSSLASAGRTLVEATSGGVLAEKLGWVRSPSTAPAALLSVIWGRTITIHRATGRRSSRPTLRA